MVHYSEGCEYLDEEAFSKNWSHHLETKNLLSGINFKTQSPIMKSFLPFFFTLFTFNFMLAQNENTPLPFAEIPPAPEAYTAETVAARMVDGLGFRYYWATEGLRPEDLDYRTCESARTSLETLDHIHGLSTVVVNAVRQMPNIRGGEKPEMTFAEMRKATLENLKEASDLLRSGEVKLEDCPVVFQSDDRTSEYPFWNNLNGPLADALWHTGQIVSMRRASGNPFNSKVSVFNGKVRE